LGTKNTEQKDVRKGKAPREAGVGKAPTYQRGKKTARRKANGAAKNANLEKQTQQRTGRFLGKGTRTQYKRKWSCEKKKKSHKKNNTQRKEEGDHACKGG